MSGDKITNFAGTEDFASHFGVSRESVERLRIYQSLLVKWQNAQNLISSTTLPDVWHRHFADSAQLLSLVGDNDRVILDLGSGGGFPGLVLAVLLADSSSALQPRQIHLVEATGRKCGFLREVVRQTGLSNASQCELAVEIHHARIEEFADSSHGFKADLITARALAPLTSLLELALPFFSTNSRALFLKGRDLEAEIETAQKAHAFGFQVHKSQTDPDGKIVEISHLMSPLRR